MKSAALRSVPATPVSKTDHAAWQQNFPVFEQILTTEPPSPLVEKVEKTCRMLHEVIQTGSEADRARAQAAMTAYGRSLDLLTTLTKARDKMAGEK